MLNAVEWDHFVYFTFAHISFFYSQHYWVYLLFAFRFYSFGSSLFRTHKRQSKKERAKACACCLCARYRNARKEQFAHQLWLVVSSDQLILISKTVTYSFFLTTRFKKYRFRDFSGRFCDKYANLEVNRVLKWVIIRFLSRTANSDFF